MGKHLKCNLIVALLGALALGCASSYVEVKVSRYQGDLILSEEARLKRAESLAVATGSRLVDGLVEAIRIDQVLQKRLERLEGYGFEKRWIGHSREIALLKSHRSQLNVVSKLAMTFFEDRIKEVADDAKQDGLIRALRSIPDVDLEVQELLTLTGEEPANIESKIARERDGDAESVKLKYAIAFVESLRGFLRTSDASAPHAEVNRKLLLVAEQFHAIQRTIEEINPRGASLLKWRAREREHHAINDRNRRRVSMDQSDSVVPQTYKSLSQINRERDRALSEYREYYSNQDYASVGDQDPRATWNGMTAVEILRREDEKELIYEKHFLLEFLEPVWISLQESYPHISGLANFYEKTNSKRREPDLRVIRALQGKISAAIQEVIDKEKEEVQKLRTSGELAPYFAAERVLQRAEADLAEKAAVRKRAEESLQKARCAEEEAKDKGNTNTQGSTVPSSDAITSLVTNVVAAANAHEAATTTRNGAKTQLEKIGKESATHLGKFNAMQKGLTALEAQFKEIKEMVSNDSSLTAERNRQWGLVIRAQTTVLDAYLKTLSGDLNAKLRSERLRSLLEELELLRELESSFVNVATTGAYLSLENIRHVINRQDRPDLFHIDDWNEVTTARAEAGAKAEYVIMRDHLGNWNVKSTSNDPTELIRAATNGVIAAISLATESGNMGQNLKNRLNNFATKYESEKLGVEGLDALVQDLKAERLGLEKAIDDAKKALDAAESDLAKAKESESEPADPADGDGAADDSAAEDAATKAEVTKKAEEAVDAAKKAYRESLEAAQKALPDIETVLARLSDVLSSMGEDDGE